MLAVQILPRMTPASKWRTYRLEKGVLLSVAAMLAGLSLARAQAIATLRYSRAGARAERTEDGLLTVEQVAAHLGGISEAQVYRLAKTGLRAAAVDVGEGTLRFDPVRLDRFIEARRRGSSSVDLTVTYGLPIGFAPIR